METDISAWYFSVPKVTRYMVTAAFGLTVISNLGFLPFLSPYNLILDYYKVLHNFQIWRLVTCVFFFGKLGFPFVINMIFMYRYSLQLETGLFDGRRADFVFMLCFQVAILWVVAFFMQLLVLGPCLCVAMIYVWSQVNRDAIVTFWFGLRFRAMYFPWVLAGFTVLMGGSPVLELVGIAVGHVYFFLEFTYPPTYGRTLLFTPQFLKNMFPDDRPVVHGFAPPTRPTAARAAGGGGGGGGGYQWGGTGQRLGGD